MNLPMPVMAIDPRTTAWLLQRPHPLPDFFHRGIAALTPRDDQTVLGRVVAETDFETDGAHWAVVAILTAPDASGLHRLLDLAIRRRRDRWPTLVSE